MQKKGNITVPTDRIEDGVNYTPTCINGYNLKSSQFSKQIKPSSKIIQGSPLPYSVLHFKIRLQLKAAAEQDQLARNIYSKLENIYSIFILYIEIHNIFHILTHLAIKSMFHVLFSHAIRNSAIFPLPNVHVSLRYLLQ